MVKPETQDIVRKHIKWRVSRDNSIHIWSDSWLPDKANPKVTTFPYPFMEHATVDNLKDSTDRDWDENIIKEMFNTRDAQLILKLPLPVLDSPDKVIWSPKEDGAFSIKRCYRVLNVELPHEEKGYWTPF